MSFHKTTIGIVLGVALLSTLYAADYTVNLTIDRTPCPKLYYADLTLKAGAGGATAASVKVDGQTVASTIVNDSVVFTTSGSKVVISLTGSTSSANVGKFAKAVLKDNKKWAWSHSLDDNYSLDDEIAAFKAKGYRALSFLIGSSASAQMVSTMSGGVADGWNFGNHTWSHKYFSDFADTPAVLNDINQCQTALYGFLKPINPAYVVIAFAAPMFDGKYGNYVRKLRDKNQTDLQFCESGNYNRMRVDPKIAGYNGWVPWGYYFDIGRYDWVAANDYAGWQKSIDSMHLMANDYRHFWYNSFNHGPEDNNNLVPKAVNYVYTTYGAGGTKEAWVAPSDEIYSYMLVRDRSIVTNPDSTGVRLARHAPTSSIVPGDGTTGIFDLLGNRISARNPLSLNSRMAGAYFVRRVSGGKVEVEKVLVRGGN
jgi:peptidoglycan/xylan/chitin deacetylase (PgdA/CDA1 family)